MPRKKLSAKTKNELRKQDLQKQSLSLFGKFAPKYVKDFVIEDLITRYNNINKVVPKKITVQDFFNEKRNKDHYENLLTNGLQGNDISIDAVIQQAKNLNTEFYINEHGKEKKIDYKELGYKLNLFAQKLLFEHDAQSTRIMPKYFLLPKGKRKVVITIPDIKDEDLEESTGEEFNEYLFSNGVFAITSPPKKKKEDEKRRKERKEKKLKLLETTKKKYYKEWRKQQAAKKKKAIKKKTPKKKK